MESAFFWLLLNFISILVLAFFSMEEMACVSFNKVRLQFYVSQGNSRAIRLNSLLQNPTTLFGTTLIGVNVATFFGSECARRFHEAIGLPPDIAPLSQIFLVIVFGELAPMFAARRYAENVALLGIPLLYVSAIILKPFIYLLGLISKLSNRLLGGSEPHPYQLLTQDELQKVLEEHDEEHIYLQEGEEFNALTSNIFRLRGKLAKHVMMPLAKNKLFSSQATIQQTRSRWPLQDNYILVFHRAPENIIGIVFLKDIIHVSPSKKLHEFCSSPWFTGLSTPVIQILKQFRRNSEHVAVVVNEKGRSVGYLTFEDILDEIFEKSSREEVTARQVTFIEKTVPGEMTLKALENELGIKLEGDPDQTLSRWIIQQIDRHPEVDEVIVMPPFEFTIVEASLLDIKSVLIKTYME